MYAIARNEAERMKLAEKKRMWVQIGNDLEEDYKGTRNLLYSMAKNFRNKNNESSQAVKDANGDLLIEHEDIACRWGEHFDAL